MSAPEVPISQPHVKGRVVAHAPTIPFLKGGSLVVIVGAEAHTALARLRVAAAAAGQHIIEFSPCVFIKPAQYARIMKDTARRLKCPVLIVPFPGTEDELSAAADMTVIAPRETGNRVWLAAGGEAFSIHLPEFAADACGLLAPLLLDGTVELFDTHLARPKIRATPAIAAQLRAHLAATHQPSPTVH